MKSHDLRMLSMVVLSAWPVLARADHVEPSASDLAAGENDRWESALGGLEGELATRERCTGSACAPLTEAYSRLMPLFQDSPKGLLPYVSKSRQARAWSLVDRMLALGWSPLAEETSVFNRFYLDYLQEDRPLMFQLNAFLLKRLRQGRLDALPELRTPEGRLSQLKRAIQARQLAWVEALLSRKNIPLNEERVLAESNIHGERRHTILSGLRPELAGDPSLTPILAALRKAGARRESCWVQIQVSDPDPLGAPMRAAPSATATVVVRLPNPQKVLEASAFQDGWFEVSVPGQASPLWLHRSAAGVPPGDQPDFVRAGGKLQSCSAGYLEWLDGRSQTHWWE